MDFGNVQIADGKTQVTAQVVAIAGCSKMRNLQECEKCDRKTARDGGICFQCADRIGTDVV